MSEAESAKVKQIVFDVFNRAKQADEFEFAVAILDLTRGLRPHRDDDPLNETESFVMDMIGLINAPLEKMTRIRLGLMAYIHMVESKPIYEELANLLRIIAGERAIPEPFLDLYRTRPGKPSIPPSAKRIVDFLSCLAHTVGEDLLANEIKGMLDDEIRNAVVHSDYFFHENCFMTDHRRSGNSPRLNNGIPLEDLWNIIVRGATFFEAVRNTSELERRSYNKPTLVMARLGLKDEMKPAVLLADEAHGLYGISGQPNI